MSGIRALARRLELSIGTVSRALNGRPDVNPATRDRVLSAARRLLVTMQTSHGSRNVPHEKRSRRAWKPSASKLGICTA